MCTCGLSDQSDNRAFDLGEGYSVRGVEAFRLLSAEMGLHSLDLTNPGFAFVDSFVAEAPRA
ncbi:hypothetical protein OSH08_13140 [Kaistia geumhonensis]|uniref:Uncharacterized protein n=1 Tax=Kaistia geumhonensis TaxID=410839 RepID=A0ABU0M1T8_9HYPH|nr:hypothetical protein [Kaistia geumhonensis]MCX5479957.1 hypothetical protein [Kaistia geumhonensis]MDQ0514815.1 hypothetical protein [Kaistia geumhonensis]